MLGCLVESLKFTILHDMNKPTATNELIPVRDFAQTYISRRGHPVSVQYIYKLIQLNKENGKPLPFEYKEIDKAIWIVK